MDISYERPLTGADVLARARAAGIPPEALRIIAATVPPEAEFADLAALSRIIGHERLGIASGRWNHAFGPLFGEFE